MSVNNIYKHNARSYYDIYSALVNAYPKKPTWIFKEMGGLFDHISELTNRYATDILYPVTREAAYGFAAKCDYEPIEADGSTVELTITLNTAMAKVLSTGYQVGGISAATGRAVIFELTEDGDSGATDTITVFAKQKKTFTSIPIGQVANSDDFAEYPIDGYLKIIKDSASLVISSLGWTRVDNFDNSISTDKHFQILYQSRGKARIRFGDDTNGAKPAIGETIYLTCEITEGQYGQMEIGEITINSGGDNDISAVTNAAATSGGNDAESVASILRNARANVRLRNIIWSQEDLETAASQSSSNVQKALGITGIGIATVHIVPSGGGAPSAVLKTTTQTYMQALTQFGKMPIIVSDPTYVTVNVTADITVRSGFVAATIVDLTEFALTMATTAIDNEIMEYYDDNGIDACRIVKINTVWSWAFTDEENGALEFIILKWRELLGTRDYRDWGQDQEVGDLWIMGNSLYDYGVDVFSLTAPVANTSAGDAEIIDSGTVTVTDIT